jgi:ubiquinone/menaquinone biosynthesis C-methylase UbiE
VPAGDPRRFDLLDVGTGTGALALGALARWPGAQVTGVDPSGRMLDLAADGADQLPGGATGRLRLLQGSFDRLPVANESMDVAISSFVIQLVPSRAAGLREIGRVLRPGGRFACITWQAESNPFEPDDAFLMALDELEIDVPPIDHDARPYTSPEAAAAELRREGFGRVRAQIEWLEHRYTPESFLEVLQHWIESDLFDELEPETRERLRRLTLEKLRRLRAEAFVWRRPLISVAGDLR